MRSTILRTSAVFVFGVLVLSGCPGETETDADVGMDATVVDDAGFDANTMVITDTGPGPDTGPDTGVTDGGVTDTGPGFDAAGCMTGAFGTSTFGGSCWGT